MQHSATPVGTSRAAGVFVPSSALGPGGAPAPVRRSTGVALAEQVRVKPADRVVIADSKGKVVGFGHRVYKNYDPRATMDLTRREAIRRMGLLLAGTGG